MYRMSYSLRIKFLAAVFCLQFILVICSPWYGVRKDSAVELKVLVFNNKSQELTLMKRDFLNA